MEVCMLSLCSFINTLPPSVDVLQSTTSANIESWDMIIINQSTGALVNYLRIYS